VTAGQPPDFPTIYAAEFAYVWKTLRRLGAPLKDLEDLTHDLFVVVHRRLSEYDPARPLRPWLFGIAVRVVSDYRRAFRNSREVLDPVTSTPDAIDQAPRQDETVAGSQARTLLMKALDRVDFDRRVVLVMHDLDEVPIPEIASTLDIPMNTAYSRLRLARADVLAAIRYVREPEGTA
jgi:RNA polymerase sigma-70 factor (ECF subfamily)